MRLIDADELKTLYDDAEFADEKWRVPIRVILANIDDMPTVDPVNHGRWVDDYNETEPPLFRKAWKCSACGFRTSYGKPKYCMNCGARMDGESDE